MKPDSKDTVHVVPCAGQFTRRLVLYPSSLGAAPKVRAREALDRVGQGFATAGTGPDGEWFSWSNPDTARYFPQRVRLPETYTQDQLDEFDAFLTNGYTNMVDDFLNGTAFNEPGTASRMGWAHPIGESGQGAPGGYGIYEVDGVGMIATKSFDGLRYFYAQMRAATERMPSALIGDTGDPTRHEDWVTEIQNGDLKFDMDIIESYDEFCPTTAWDQNATVAAASAPNAPSYETSLLGWKRWDQAHLVRYTRLLMTLAWIANDPLAKDELRLMSELFRLTFTELPCTAPAGWKK